MSYLLKGNKITNFDEVRNNLFKSISNNNGYTWSVTLCKATHTIHLYGYTSSSSYYWYSGSNVVLKKGSTVIGTYTCSSKYYTSFTFSV